MISDLGILERLEPAEISATVSFLREKLRAILLREAVTTAGALWPDVLALEGLEDQPVVSMDGNLIEAFSDVENIDVDVL